MWFIPLILVLTNAPNDPSAWLREVEYIISEAERKDFLKLSTETQRESFIEEFWKSRDVDPSTEANEFQEAYLERLAFAHENFGPRSDRARVFILNGRPDQRLVYPEMKLEEVLSRAARARTPSSASEASQAVPASLPTIRIESPEAEIWSYYYAYGSRNLGGPLELVFMRVPAGELSTLFAAGHVRNQMLLAQMFGNTPFFRGSRTAFADFTLVYAGPPRFGHIQDFYHQLLNNPATFDMMEISRTVAEARRSLGDAPESVLRRRQLQEDVESAVFFDTIRAHLDHWIFRSAEDYVYLPFAVSFPGEELDRVQRFDIVADMKKGGDSVAYFIDELRMDPKSQPSLKHEGLVYQSRFAVAPGEYLLDFHVLDRMNGRYVRITEPILIPEFDREEFSLSDLVLCKDVVEGDDARKQAPFRSGRDWLIYSDLNPLNADNLLLIPQPGHRFRRRDTMTVFFEIYNPSLQNEKPEIGVRLKVLRKSNPVAVIDTDSLQYLTEDKLPKISFAKSLSLSQLQPGLYELEIEVTDIHTGYRLLGKGSFEVM